MARYTPTHYTPDHPGYAEFATQLTRQPLADEWRRDADSGHEPGTAYMAMVSPNGEAATWAGYRFEEHNGLKILRVCNMYERRGHRREDINAWLFPELLFELHKQVVTPHRGLAYCYSYIGPKGLLEAMRWQADPCEGGTGVHTKSDGETVQWWRMVRFPS